jgi:LuxR family maltose regulon positive regulatory protein
VPAPIIAAKLFVPPPRPRAAARPRLFERLERDLFLELPRRAAFGRQLTLVCASAGSGKTTLLSEWSAALGASRGVKTAWLSLDEGDCEPGRFLIYLAAALQSLHPEACADILELLQSPQPPPVEASLPALLATLLNEIAALPQPGLLVLDDYHLVNSGLIDQALAALIERLPPTLHLVISSREQPRLPLARLRVRAQLLELRPADLRFTVAEAAEFLKRTMGLQLAAGDVAALEARTEGWISGLQLAALSLQGGGDFAGFIQAFTGSHRFVLDYLVEEVLQRQPAGVRSFLLQTSLLEQLTAPLCDAVCGRQDGRQMLEALERGNLFINPLDDRRQAYRYHHLFGEALQARLLQEQPALAPELHRRASAWFEQHGAPDGAIRHALAGCDYERAARLIELAWPEMDISLQSAAWLAWARTLPEELLHRRPVLIAGIAWALLDGGEMQTSQALLDEAERDLAAAGAAPGAPLPPGPVPAGLVVDDWEQYRSLPAIIAAGRAYRALALEQVQAAAGYARQALALCPEDDQIRRIQGIAMLGIAQYAGGDLLGAERSLSDFLASLHAQGDLNTTVGIAFTLANLRLALGRLSDAEMTYRQELELAVRQGEPFPTGAADLYRGLSELACERGDLQAAARLLATGKALGEKFVLTGWRYRLLLAEARLRQAQGDLDGALELLDEAEQQYIRSPLPEERPIPALRARLWIAQGCLEEAWAWAQAQALTAEAALSYLSEFNHLIYVRLLIAGGRREQDGARLADALRLLERLQQAAQSGGRAGSLIAIFTQQALARQAQSDLPAALACLGRALALAEPQGYQTSFVVEGPAMKALLEAALQEGISPAYVRRLLAAFSPPAQELSPDGAPGEQALVEPLSERELEVLHLLAGELSGPEIADRLVVSLSTVRTHTRHIYAKLGVDNRRAAVRRAGDLGLLLDSAPG